MALKYLFDIGADSDDDNKVRGFLDFNENKIVIYDDTQGVELSRIPSGDSGGGDILLADQYDPDAIGGILLASEYIP